MMFTAGGSVSAARFLYDVYELSRPVFGGFGFRQKGG
jgi:hypothetical protein